MGITRAPIVELARDKGKAITARSSSPRPIVSRVRTLGVFSNTAEASAAAFRSPDRSPSVLRRC